MKKTFDCVEMQHRGGAEVQALTAGMTLEEQMAFWREEARKLREWQQELRRERGLPPRPGAREPQATP